MKVPVQSGPRVILVVDDSRTNQMLMSAVLDQAGFKVLLAANATECLAVLAGIRPALILMDLQLPGKDGLALTREILAGSATAGIPIIALTARAMAGDREAALEAGCVAYMTKPINSLTLASDVALYIRDPTG